MSRRVRFMDQPSRNGTDRAADSPPEKLRRLEEWKNQFVPVGSDDFYLEQNLDFIAATLFVDQLLPKFVRVNGCMIRKDRYAEDNFNEWWKSDRWPTVAERIAGIELVLNKFVLWDQFEPEADEDRKDDPESSAEFRAAARMADQIAKIWQWHIRETFPDRKFVVEAFDGYGPTVCVYTDVQWLRDNLDLLEIPRD